MEAAEVVKHLRAKLEAEPLVDLHRDPLELQFQDGVLTVSGEVADIPVKRLILELAAAMPSVTRIVDRLRVRPAERMGDATIADHLEHALIRESAFSECTILRREGDSVITVRAPGEGRERGRIAFEVGDGVVTLDGEVASLSHKRLAGVLAWWVPGTRDVVNGLRVEPPERDSDEEILDALRVVLDKDPLLDATQVSASCENGVITLQGLVDSEAQQDLAAFDAWALFGVDKVVNRIEVRPA